MLRIMNIPIPRMQRMAWIAMPMTMILWVTIWQKTIFPIINCKRTTVRKMNKRRIFHFPTPPLFMKSWKNSCVNATWQSTSVTWWNTWSVHWMMTDCFANLWKVSATNWRFMPVSNRPRRNWKKHWTSYRTSIQQVSVRVVFRNVCWYRFAGKKKKRKLPVLSWIWKKGLSENVTKNSPVNIGRRL